MDTRQDGRADQANQERGQRATEAAVSRREVLGGGLFLGLLTLGGCAGGGSGQSRLPDVKWNLPQVAEGPVCILPPPPSSRPPVDVPTPGTVRVIPRSAWAAAAPRKSVIHPMNGVSRITVHHEGSIPFSSTGQGDVAARLRTVQQSHFDRRAKTGEHWGDIGYHYVIDPAGRIWEGRDVRYQGAHVQDQNEHNLGIMVLGNFEQQKPTPAALASLDAFVTQQMRLYSVSLSRVRTHRELAPTECPGQNLQRYMNEARGRGGRIAMLAAEMNLA